jgi:hypothetical protein
MWVGTLLNFMLVEINSINFSFSPTKKTIQDSFHTHKKDSVLAMTSSRSFECPFCLQCENVTWLELGQIAHADYARMSYCNAYFCT